MARALLHRLLPLLAVLALATLCAAPAAPAAPAAGVKPVRPDPANLGREAVRISDTVLDDRGAARAAAFVAPIRARTGETVRIALSDSYGPSQELARTWADFFAGLPHGSELQSLTAFVAPFREVQSLCGAQADACYSPFSKTLVIPGAPPPDGVPVEEIAAHEYAHHIARSRSNYPWPALDWGTKRWATGESVCRRVGAGRLFPGDEGRRYPLNPGEAFADAYRVLVGGRWSGLFDASFRPSLADLGRIREDVLDPWLRNTVEVRKGSFTRTGSATRRLRFDAPLDGRLKVTTSAAGGQDLDLVLRDAAGRRLVSATKGRSPGVSGDLCGVRSFTVEVRRARGAGGFRVEVSRA